MSNKHTKAPWVVRFLDPEDKESDFFVQGPKPEGMAHGIEILGEDYGDHCGYPYEQRLSDAKLIAAAPELLEALINLVDVCEKAIPNQLPIIKNAKEAIEKATK